MERVKVLVVEDEFVTGCEIQARLEDIGYKVVAVVNTGEDAITKVLEFNPQVVIMDITLIGDMTGIEAAEQIKKQFGIPVIYLTAHSDDATIEKAVVTEPFGYLIKPLEERALQTAIQMALYKHSLDQALKESEKRYRAIAELTPDSIYIINSDYSLAYMNTSAIRFFHCSTEDVDKTSLSTLLPADMAKQILSIVDVVFSIRTSVRETVTGKISDIDIWLDTTLVPVLSDEGEVTQVIGLSRDITAMILLEKEVEKKGIKQIEHNMEQFQILNDQIRNPLAIIMSAASLTNSQENEIIIEQAKKIDKLITKLDQGWVTSASVRAFLLKHYGHGKEI
jgi:PAS domain S-box-containing protein